ncbi:uncharacterized protein Dvar_38740 [Desulfosarcina variabilis str. Montpellier]
MEMKYAKKKVYWPDLNEILTRKNFAALINETDIDWTFGKNYHFINGNKILPKDLYGKKIINFSYEEFLEALKAELSKLEVWTHEQIINSIGKCFFRCWDNGIHFKEECLYLINHMSMMCFAGADYFFRYFPNGRIIHSIRSPWDWYASMQNHFRANDDVKFFKYSMNLWRESTIRGIQNSNTFKKYLLIRYEDLVLNWNKTKIKLQEFLQIENIQDVPTIGGQCWKGNSSYGPKLSMNSKSVFIADKILSKEKIDYIKENYGELASICGYTVDSLKAFRNQIFYKDELLQIIISLSEKFELERLRNDTKRFSALLYNTHRDYISKIRK